MGVEIIGDCDFIQSAQEQDGKLYMAPPEIVFISTLRVGTPVSASIIPASEFQFDPVNLTCQCSTVNQITYRRTRAASNGITKAYFEARLLQCRLPQEAPLHAQPECRGSR